MSRISDFFEADKQGRRWNRKMRTNWNQPDKEPEEPKEKLIGKFLWWVYGDLSNKWTVWYVTLEIITVVWMALDVARSNWVSFAIDAFFLWYWIDCRRRSQRKGK